MRSRDFLFADRRIQLEGRRGDVITVVVVNGDDGRRIFLIFGPRRRLLLMIGRSRRAAFLR